MLVLVGLGPEVTPVAVRRAAGASARAVENVASVALALPADDAALVRAAVEGFALGSYAFDGYKSSPAEAGPGEVVVLTENARRQELTTALAEAQVVAAAVAATRDWVNTPPGDLTPGVFAEAVADRGSPGRKARSGRSGSPVGQGTQGRHRGCRGHRHRHGRGRARRSRLRRHPRRGPGLRQPSPDGAALLHPQGGHPTPRARREGDHLRLRRPLHQARSVDGHDEAGHGRRRRGGQRHLRHRRARPPGARHHLRADGGEHDLRLGHPARRRPHDVPRQDRRGAQHRRRGTADPGRRARTRRRGGARPDRRRRHADRRVRDRPRRPGVGAVRQRRLARRPDQGRRRAGR